MRHTRLTGRHILRFGSHHMHNCTPVSYTHLDVYKRQAEDRTQQPDPAQQKAVAVAAAFLAKQMEE